MTSKCTIFAITAPGTGHGKTLITAGLARLFHNLGLKTQVFKAGPDFIDPQLLALASNQPVFNVDLWMLGEEACKEKLNQAIQHNDMIILECVMGLYDGAANGFSSADLVEALNIPVIPVINACGMGQTFGAIALGLQHMRPSLKFAGVIANQVGSNNHQSLLTTLLPPEIPLLAAIPRTPTMHIQSRHLGLIQAQEITTIDTQLNEIATLLEKCGLARLSSLTNCMIKQPKQHPTAPSMQTGYLANKRIAIAKDRAFSFIYANNVQLLKELGISIQFFSPLLNEPVPEDADALWLPGGYPELYAKTLSHTSQTQQSLKAHAAHNKPILAECGGMLYLLEQLRDQQGNTWPMCGLLNASAILTERFQTVGLQEMEWPEGRLRGHSFHHSKLVNSALNPIQYGQRVRGDAQGEALFQVGSVRASYFHAYFASNLQAVTRFFFNDETSRPHPGSNISAITDIKLRSIN